MQEGLRITNDDGVILVDNNVMNFTINNKIPLSSLRISGVPTIGPSISIGNKLQRSGQGYILPNGGSPSAVYRYAQPGGSFFWGITANSSFLNNTWFAQYPANVFYIFTTGIDVSNIYVYEYGNINTAIVDNSTAGLKLWDENGNLTYATNRKSCPFYSFTSSWSYYGNDLIMVMQIPLSFDGLNGFGVMQSRMLDSRWYFFGWGTAPNLSFSSLIDVSYMAAKSSMFVRDNG